jgi:ABC-type glutathione transport system ATPase component
LLKSIAIDLQTAVLLKVPDSSLNLKLNISFNFSLERRIGMNLLSVYLENDIKEAIKNKRMNENQVKQTMNDAAKEYIDQFSDKSHKSNAIAIKLFLSGDFITCDFERFTKEAVEIARKKGIEAKNYFEILLEKVREGNKK